LLRFGERVVEVGRPKRPPRRTGTKSNALVAAVAPWLLELPGVGSISAAQVLVSWSHAGRLRSEAAFAALAGVNPIPASSGQVVRHRLNRSGDRRQLFKLLERYDRSTVELIRVA
jgi:transposase